MRYEELYEMAFTRKVAAQHILGLAFQFNVHLLKLRAFGNFSEGLQEHWRKEVKNFLRQIAVIRLRPERKPGKASWYLELLYRNWFEGTEVENTATMMRQIAEQYEEEGELAVTPTIAPEAAAAWLREYHTRLSERLSRAEDVSDMVPSARQP